MRIGRTPSVFASFCGQIRKRWFEDDIGGFPLEGPLEVYKVNRFFLEPGTLFPPKIL